MWQWDDLRFFLAISREGTLSGASRVLNVDHATVGRRLGALERQLGAKLFDRTPSGFQITAAGRRILVHCEVIENASISVERLIAGSDQGISGRVSLATTEILAHRVMLPMLAALHRQHPELQIVLLSDVRPLDVSRRQADVAVRLVRPTDATLVCRKLGEFGLAPYASREYLKRHGSPKRGSDLAGHFGVSYPMMPSWFAQPLSGSRTVLSSNSPLVQLQAVREGLGIGEFPCCLADQYPELRRLWPDEPPMLRPVWLVIHPDLRRAAKVRLLSNAIVGAFEREATVLKYGLAGRAKNGKQDCDSSKCGAARQTLAAHAPYSGQ